MARTRKRSKPAKAKVHVIGPTPELERRGVERIGMATKRVDVIETMRRREQLSEEHYRRLSKFSDTYAMAERSPVKSCLNDNPGGTGNGPSAAVISALIQVGWWQRDMPADCWEIAVAVCGRNLSLTEFCVEKFGGRERYNSEGDFIAIVPVNEKARIAEALTNLRFAAGYIVA